MQILTRATTFQARLRVQPEDRHQGFREEPTQSLALKRTESPGTKGELSVIPESKAHSVSSSTRYAAAQEVPAPVFGLNSANLSQKILKKWDYLLGVGQ